MYQLAEIAPLLRKHAGLVGMDRADRWLGLSDRGNGTMVRILRLSFAPVYLPRICSLAEL